MRDGPYNESSFVEASNRRLWRPFHVRNETRDFYITPTRTPTLGITSYFAAKSQPPFMREFADGERRREMQNSTAEPDNVRSPFAYNSDEDQAAAAGVVVYDIVCLAHFTEDSGEVMASVSEKRLGVLRHKRPRQGER